MLRHLALVAAVSLSATTALAAQPRDQISVPVRVADLQLETPAGARVALYRIRAAAQFICGGEPGSRQLGRSALAEACVRETVDRAVVASHSPTLATLNGTAPQPTTLAAAQ